MTYTTSQLMGAVMQMLALIGAPAKDIPPKEVMCLARIIHNEARGESVRGQIAVANVVVNRGGKNACRTVTQKGQFARPVANVDRWEDWTSAVEIAGFVLVGYIGDVTDGAQYFNTADRKPTGMGQHVVTLREGGHIFYRGEWKSQVAQDEPRSKNEG